MPMKGIFAMNKSTIELVKAFSDLEIKLISQYISGKETKNSGSFTMSNCELDLISKSVHFDVLNSLVLLYIKHTCTDFTPETIPNIIIGSYTPVDINICVNEFQLIPDLCE